MYIPELEEILGKENHPIIIFYKVLLSYADKWEVNISVKMLRDILNEIDSKWKYSDVRSFLKSAEKLINRKTDMLFTYYECESNNDNIKFEITLKEKLL